MERILYKLFICVIWTATFYIPGEAEWSTCSATCNGGTQWGKVCAFGGSICGKKIRKCNTDACVTGWEKWSPCSRHCGGGTRFMVKRCESGDILKCPKTYGDCATNPCPPLPSCPPNEEARYKNPSSCCKKIKSACGVPEQTHPKRVFGGEEAELGQWPWAVTLVHKPSEDLICGASLIHSQWAVTAAHCIIYPSREVKALLGTINRKTPAATSTEYDVMDFITHDSFSFPLNDIALVNFNGSVKYSSAIKPICLPSGEIIQEEKTCFVAGWGISNPNDLRLDISSDVLMQADVRILPLDACKVGHALTYGSYLSNDHICAGKHGGVQDTCRGDSGGPLMCQRCHNCAWYLTGITSFGPPICGQAGVPGVYVNVRKYEDWIRGYVPLGFTKHVVC